VRSCPRWEAGLAKMLRNYCKVKLWEAGVAVVHNQLWLGDRTFCDRGGAGLRPGDTLSKPLSSFTPCDSSVQYCGRRKLTQECRDFRCRQRGLHRQLGAESGLCTFTQDGLRALVAPCSTQNRFWALLSLSGAGGADLRSAKPNTPSHPGISSPGPSQDSMTARSYALYLRDGTLLVL